MLATLVIFLREGVEASMIFAILLAYLNRSGQRQHFRDVFAGVAAALVLAAAGGVIAYQTIRSYDGSRVQTIFETVTYLLAAGVLTYMTFWMRSHARGLSSDLRARADAAISRGARTGLALLAFQAVGREGLETVVFTLAIAFSTTQRSAMLGAAIGLAIALAIAFGAGLLVDAVQNLQELGWLPWATDPLWHTGSILNEDTAAGDLLHSFFGYAQSPTVLQVCVYVLYLAVALVAFFNLRRRFFGVHAAR